MLFSDALHSDTPPKANASKKVSGKAQRLGGSADEEKGPSSQAQDDMRRARAEAAESRRQAVSHYTVLGKLRRPMLILAAALV